MCRVRGYDLSFLKLANQPMQADGGFAATADRPNR